MAPLMALPTFFVLGIALQFKALKGLIARLEREGIIADKYDWLPVKENGVWNPMAENAWIPFNAIMVALVIGIIGSLNLPVIKYSVEWWNTLHQPSSLTLTSAPTIHYTMLIPLIIMFFGMVIYSLIIFLMRYKTEVIKFKINKKKNYK